MIKNRSLRRAALIAPIAIVVLGLSAPAFAQSARGRQRITLRGSDLPLGIMLSQIGRACGMALVADKDVRLDRMVSSPNLDDVPIETALSVVLTPLGYSYQLDERQGQLKVFVYETRTFRVAMPIVVQNWAAGISNSGGADVAGDSGTLGARVALSVRSDTKGLWDEIDTSMARLLGKDEKQGGPENAAAAAPELGYYSVNRVAGFVTVRALPSVMPSVESYFDALNAEMGRSVAIEAKVMQVDLDDTKEASVDWTLLAARLGDAAFIGGQAVRSTMVGSTAPFLRLSGRAGDAFVRALEEQGKVSVLAQPTLALGNNLPAIIELARVQAYVAQQTTTIIPGGGAGTTQVTVQTSTLSDGLIISMMPRVLNDEGEVSLALAAVLQDVLEVRREDFGLGFVELPHTARRSYSGVVRARPNETLVIGGLITSRKEQVKSGIPFLSKIPIIGWIFGANRDVDVHSELVISITPREVRSVPAAPSEVRVEPVGLMQ
jgi:type II secretory pathway component GspD/PulD (secretin)